MNTVRFRMFKISVLQFAILSKVCEDNYRIETRAEFQGSTDGRAVATTVSFNFMGKEEKSLILSVRCEFGIHPEDLASLTADGKVTIRRSTLEHFLVHAVGTARGILHCKTEGTPFNVIVLPPLNVTKLVASDLTIELPKK